MIINNNNSTPYAMVHLLTKYVIYNTYFPKLEMTRCVDQLPWDACCP